MRDFELKIKNVINGYRLDIWKDNKLYQENVETFNDVLDIVHSELDKLTEEEHKNLMSSWR